ncbi:hypothetical protein [Phytohabitans kaempferiae]|uniref:Desulfoferrodoxin N-terminal domain-containing protein n=1 Tax=Phytohabitans kaempferiae TaxID=1620943 RepID=A0ABV6M705_9ACTN
MAEIRDETPVRVGSRVRCERCGTEIVVVRPPARALVCCEVAMSPLASGRRSA